MSEAKLIIRVPHHVSGFWIPVITNDPLSSGSLGAGLVLSRRLEAQVGIGEPPNDAVSRRVAEISGLGEPVAMRIDEGYPLGQGFGASAARALAQAIAIECTMGRGSLLKAAERAHRAELVEGTGLGDVIAEFYGGALVVRLRPGPPGHGVVDCYPVSKRIRIVALSLGAMSTREMHEKYLSRIMVCGRDSYRRFLDEPTLSRFVAEAQRFSLCVGFMDRELKERVESAIKKAVRLGASMGFFVKKRLLVVVVDESCVDEVAEALRKEFKCSVWIDRVGASGVEVERP